jgi:hypothetical protein
VQHIVSVGNGTLALCNTRIHVIRSAIIALAMITIRIYAPVEVSGHRQDMGQHATDVRLNSA